MCSILWSNFAYLRSSRLNFSNFWLDSCIVNKGEKFELVLGYWMHLEVFRVVSSHFLALCVTCLTGCGHRSDRSECWSYAHVEHQWWRPVCFLQVVCIHSSRGELHWFRGSLHVCRGSSLWFSRFGLVVCTLCLSMVLSRMCRAVALA
jgi:hypothetical protein